MNNESKTHPSAILKFCPACGAEGFTFSGEKLFTCPSCGFTLYINPAAAVAAVIELPDGRIVLTRRKHEPRAGCLDLPGGFVDIMESAEDAIKREIREELGIDIRSLCFLGAFPNEYVYGGLSYFTCDIGFSCISDEPEKIRPADDVSEAILILPEEINFSEIAFPSVKKILRLYIKQKAGKTVKE